MIFLLVGQGRLFGQIPQDKPRFRSDQILVKPRGGLNEAAALHAALGGEARKTFPRFGNLQVVRIPEGANVEAIVAAYNRSGLVEYAEPDFVGRVGADPNDPQFTSQWTLVDASYGIHAKPAWNYRTASESVVVAVIDTGVRYTHEDLALNMWRNTSEVAGNGLDDDGNGFVDDIHGWNAIAWNGDVSDDNRHGTHVAGILGAVGNNGKGIAGVAWRVKIMACKAFDESGSGYQSDVIECFDYAIKNGARIINASYGFQAFSHAELDAIRAAGNAGIIVVAAAMNQWGDDIDVDGEAWYPAAYDADNIVAVAATTPSTLLASYSNVGLVRVDLAAPGGELPPESYGVLSTLNDSDTQYERLSGTSMSAPHVSGAFALLKAQFPNDSYLELINRVLATTDSISALTGKCQTGGRLNLFRALTSISSAPPNDAFANSFKIYVPPSDEFQDSITASGNNVNANKEAGEPNHGGNVGGRSVWWHLTAAATQQITVTTKGSGLDTLLGIYTGSSVSSLTKIADQGVSDGCSWCQVVFTVTANTTYHIAVDGYGGAQGIIKLTITAVPSSPPQTLRFDPSSLQRSGGTFSGQLIGPPNTNVSIERFGGSNQWLNTGSVTLSSGGTAPFGFSHLGPVGLYRAKTSTQINSCNAVGFWDMTVSAGVSKMVANPFNAVDNGINALFPNPPNGSYLYKWDDVTDNYQSSVSVAGVWTPNRTLKPGEGAIFQTSSGYEKGLVGEVLEGYLVNNIPSGWSIRASNMPLTGTIQSTLGVPIGEGDSLLQMVSGSYQAFAYHNGVWLNETGLPVAEPSIAAGESFWIHKPTDWKQIVSVWP